MNSNDPLEEEADVLIVDAMLGQEWLGVQLGRIKQRQKLRWLVVNQSGSPHEYLQYFQAGAAGVLSDEYDDETLLKCIETVRAGGVCIEAKMSQILAMRQIKKMLAPFVKLSSREFDVFCLLAEGYPMAYIAENLGGLDKNGIQLPNATEEKDGIGQSIADTRMGKKTRIDLM